MTRSTEKPRVLVVGKDARTDAMAAACLAGERDLELFALSDMRTPGLHEKCQDVFIGKVNDSSVRRKAIERLRPDLVLVGPEEPLADGFVDELEQAGIAAFGPTRRLARIESSKSWAREVLDRHGIPGNPEYRVIENSHELRGCLEELGDFVIKPDGLTAGKGVRVFGEHLQTVEEALAYAEPLIAADGRVEVEERLDGQEFSLQTITDGKDLVHCPLVQDHKRAFEGDQGPNTGGMGSYSCADASLPFLAKSDVAEAHSISERVIEALASEVGSPYRGVLYGGFIATADGIRLIEYNARFGDPEAMNVLPLLEGDFVELCTAAATDRLGRVDVSFAPKATVCKYVVPAAYPDVVTDPGRIAVPEGVRDENTHWYWAACELESGEVALTGSRSGAAVGIGDTLDAAEQRAEKAASAVEGDVRHRADIGRPEAVAARMRHMTSLRPNSPSSHTAYAA